MDAAAPLPERGMPEALTVPSPSSPCASSGRAFLIPEREQGCIRGRFPQESSLVPQQHKTSLILAPIYFGGSWPCLKTAGLGVLLGARVPCAEQIVGV